MTPRVSLCWLTIVLVSFLNIAQAQDTVYSGNYKILFCGAGPSDSKASQLQAALPITASILQVVLSDVKLGTKSPHGFAAFFKTDESIPTVQKVFQAIIDGANVGLDNTSPTIACADPNQDLTKNLYADCLNWRNVPLGSWPKYGVIFVSNNKLVPDNTKLSTNQFGTLVHELVHLYAPELTSIVGETSETYNVQAAVNLNAKDSLANANNYALYAAAVRAGCTDFPTMPTKGNDGVELRH